MTKEKIYCEHCKTQTKYVIDNFARWHLKKEHNMTMKEYYDLYMKKENEEFCKICGKVCFWENSTKGYCTYCSKECMYSDPDYRETVNASLQTYDREKANKKRIETNLDKYGVECVSQHGYVKEKTFQTNLDRYGEKTTLNVSHVRNARLKALEEKIDEIVQKRYDKWFARTDTEKEEVLNRRKDTCLERYGVEHVFHLDETWDKIRETNVQKYGSEYVVESNHFRSQMLSNGTWIPYEQKNDFERYYYDVNEETRKHLPKLFSEWDGRCYYFNMRLRRFNGEYDPYSISIDHKISKKYGFENNIPPEEIGSFNNLCICSRLINCVKNFLTEEEFYKSDRYHKYKREYTNV